MVKKTSAKSVNHQSAPSGALPGHAALIPAFLPPTPYPLRPASQGLTLVELIVVIAIVGILSAVAIPTARFGVKRYKEQELHRDLQQMRDAIDQYKRAAEMGAFQTKIDSFNYPPDLQTLADGVDAGDKRVRFLRKIPIDPMTGQADWAVRAMEDDPGSDSAGGANVFDVHSKSTGTALNGTKYNTW